MATSSEVREQTRAMTQQASTLMSELTRVIESMSLLLENPGRNDQHTYTEIVRLAAQIRDTSESYIDNMAFTASREPASVSLRRLAGAMGISVNTLRRKMANLNTDYPDPFEDEGAAS